MIHSIAGLIEGGELTRRRPYRAPHHTASVPALVGGGTRARPGEISLAHLGVLFLDELPEFGVPMLESLRQPLESGEVVIARANHHVRYPARFQLAAAMNPCRCGRAGEPGFTCRRGERCMTEYQARLSGPLLDRIDMRLEVPAVAATDLLLPQPAEGSAVVARRVAAARAVQTARYGGPRCNATCTPSEVEKVAHPDPPAVALLRLAAESMRLSARGFHRVLRVARTIADLEGADGVGKMHVAEALSYRDHADRTPQGG